MVASNTAKQLLLEKRSFWGGLEGFFLRDELADLLNLPARTTGFIVILSVEGISMTPKNSVKIRDMISGLSPGTSYKVSILRAGQVLELTGKAP